MAIFFHCKFHRSIFVKTCAIVDPESAVAYLDFTICERGPEGLGTKGRSRVQDQSPGNNEAYLLIND